MAADVRSNSPLLSVKILTFLLFIGLSRCEDHDLSCNNVVEAYKSRGFNEYDVPKNAVSGSELSICAQDMTCCTRDMENKLSSQSHKEYEMLRHDTIQNIVNTFASRTNKFDEFFTKLLENSKQDLHVMFVKTYGLLYKKNAEIFEDLFAELNNYYKGKNVNLAQVLSSFFVELLRRVFTLLNQQHTFSDEYLQCVASHMNDLEPFGDVPGKLSKQVKRSFVAARTFVQGLAIGRNVVEAVAEISPTSACDRALMKLMYCPHCHGLTTTKPCANLCLNTMKGCLASVAELNTSWNEYIDALLMVAGRLEGPFNIESVVDPIDVQISDAIMNFQENGIKVSEKVFQGCGRPPLARRRRDTSPDAVLNSASDSSRQNRANREAKPSGKNLNRLVRDIKEKIELAKNYWVELPQILCEENIAAPLGDGDNCWNGQDNARYIPDVQKDGIANQFNNPEVDVDVTHQDPIVILQIQQLKIITKRLRKAYTGNDVEWVDDVVFELSSGGGDSGPSYGSGSHDDTGSGSGDYGSAYNGFDDDDRSQARDDDDIDQYYFVPSNVPTKRPNTDSGVMRTNVVSVWGVCVVIVLTAWLS